MSREAKPAKPAEEPAVWRNLTLSVKSLQVRLQRRSRMASAIVLQPCRFLYELRCDWGAGASLRHLEFGSEAWRQQCQAGQRTWWDGLPASYSVQRTWQDIRKFHEAFASLIDEHPACKGLKERVPPLPEEGELERFIQGVAATGDALAMNRPRSLAALRQGGKSATDAHDELELMRAIYVECRLKPYFLELSHLFAAIGAEVLRDFKPLLHFATSGHSCRQTPILLQDGAPNLPMKTFCGPGPAVLEPKELMVLAMKLRRPRVEFDLSEPAPASPHAAHVAHAAHAVHSVQAKPTEARKGLPRHSANPITVSVPTSPKAGSAADTSYGSSPVARHTEAPADFFGNSLWKDLELDRPDRPGRRMASSHSGHYGFFASEVPPRDFGCSSERDMWQRMVARERRKICQGALLVKGLGLGLGLGDSGSLRPSSTSRLPRLHPPGINDSFRLSQESWATGFTEGSLGHLPRKEALRRANVKQSGIDRVDIYRRDIGEGLAALVLGESLPTKSKVQRIEAQRAPGDDEAQKVYRLYYTLLAMEDASPVTVDGDALRLTAISWNALLAWAQECEDVAIDFKNRSVCVAFNRRLNQYFELLSEQEKQRGIALSSFFQWLWPFTTTESHAELMEWICLSEIEKMRQPSPLIMDEKERRMLEAMFRSLCRGGSCSAEEMVRRGLEGSSADVSVFKEVCGDGDVDLQQFLELMCPDGVQAHPNARRIVAADGRHLVLQRFETVGISIWVLETVPEEEKGQWHLIRALEQEMIRLRRQAEVCPVPRSGTGTEERPQTPEERPWSYER